MDANETNKRAIRAQHHAKAPEKIHLLRTPFADAVDFTVVDFYSCWRYATHVCVPLCFAWSHLASGWRFSIEKDVVAADRFIQELTDHWSQLALTVADLLEEPFRGFPTCGRSPEQFSPVAQRVRQFVYQRGYEAVGERLFAGLPPGAASELIPTAQELSERVFWWVLNHPAHMLSTQLDTHRDDPCPVYRALWDTSGTSNSELEALLTSVIPPWADFAIAVLSAKLPILAARQEILERLRPVGTWRSDGSW